MERPSLKTLQLAADVVSQSSREEPADAVLRKNLKSGSGLTKDESRQASHLVFSYYRWLKWLDDSAPLIERLWQAETLAESFRQAPNHFPEPELVSRSVPGWIGEHMEITPAWARALQTEPRLWLRAKPGGAEDLMTRIWDCRPCPSIPNALEYSGKADLFTTPEFRDGDFEIQDLHSQVVSLVCAPQQSEKWWDACAGEGGKTLHLSALMGNSGIIWSSDRAEWRLQKLKRRAARAKVFNYRTALWDGNTRLPTKTRFDGVLVDAPCSGTGTWQRNPHARWTSRPVDITELSAIQDRLLSSAGAAVKPGGKLVYAVCTLTRAETIELSQGFTGKVAGFEPLTVRNPFNQHSPPAEHLTLRTEETGGNGMFIAAWRRV